MSDRLSAKGVAKSSGNAEMAKEVERVAAESFMTVLLLSSTLSKESVINSAFGSVSVATKKENAAMRSRDRILMTKVACFVDNIRIDIFPLAMLQ